ncbi:MAG TPA: sialidase family protein, partial [Actinomycetota bacterium]|nr:sialidase family protein [Actinomycetota bacterium]
PTRIDKPGQFQDNPDLDDKLPPTSFRAGLSPSLVVSPTTGTLAFVYQNNVNRPQSEADISIQLSTDGGATWSDARFLSVTGTGQPADNDQFFPWIDSDPAGNLVAIWYDRRRDPGNTLVDTWQAVSSDDGLTWRSRRITTQAWDSILFDFIGDYIGVAAGTAAIYPVWTDGRDLTFKGETDIFTNVEIRS